jgi:hypothetical protein
VRGDPNDEGSPRTRRPRTPTRTSPNEVLADRPDNYRWPTLFGWEIRSPLADSVRN